MSKLVERDLGIVYLRREFVAGADIKAGQLAYVGEDGKLYPAQNLKDKVNLLNEPDRL